MFDWFRKKGKQVPAEDADAYELGRRMAESANADIETYMQMHFYRGARDITDAVFGNFESPDVPPFVVARIDLKIFLARLEGDLRLRVLPGLCSAMAGWIKMADEAGVGVQIERLIELHYNRLKSTLASAAFQRFLDMTDRLKEADDQWRAANPEKAAQIPFDTFGAELGDTLQAFCIDELRADDWLGASRR